MPGLYNSQQPSVPNPRVQSWIRNIEPGERDGVPSIRSVSSQADDSFSEISQSIYSDTINRSQMNIGSAQFIHPETLWAPDTPGNRRDKRGGDDESIASSLVPPPLNLGKSPIHTLPAAHLSTTNRWNDGLQSGATPVDLSRHKQRDVDGNQGPRPRPDYASSIFRSAQSIRESLRGITRMTPSEMPYPYGLSSYRMQELDRTEQILGLRRSKPPPLPPKTSAIPLTAIAPPHSNVLPRFEDRVYEGMLLEPQNGRTAWLQATMAFLVVFNCWGINNSFGLFQAYFEASYLRQSAPSSIAWIGSTQLALVFGLGVPVGRLVDKGHFRKIFAFGSLSMVLGLFVSAWCSQLWSIWLVQGLITGAGMGMVFCSGTIALMTWFDETKIGLAMGLAAAGSCVGGIVYILIARHFLVISGYATTMRILGGVSAGTILLPNLFFRMRVQNKKGYLGEGDKSGQTRITWRIFTPAPYLTAAAGMFFSFLGIYFGFVYMISYGYYVVLLSDQASTNLLIFMLLANLPGRFIPALISDKCIGPTNMIIPSIYFSAMMIGVWMTVGKTQAGLSTVACLYGFLSAGVQVLYAPTAVAFCLETAADPNTPNTREEQRLAMDRVGVKAGGIFSCIGVACLIGTPIGGALISYRAERNFSQPFLGAQLFAMGSLILGGTLLLVSRYLRVGWMAMRA